jgi:GNAT superfamily N-acetyltransferase
VNEVRGSEASIFIRQCREDETGEFLAIINEAAVAYRGVIPAEGWHEPYMSAEHLESEIAAGVNFWGADDSDALIGVMGIQPVKDVNLIRHAYTRSAQQGRGIGSALLAHLRSRSERPILIGTWKAARWAIRFYERHGFVQASPHEALRLLRTYWTIPDSQVETSVVLVEQARE